MDKKIYVKPQMEELTDAGMSLLAGSGMGSDNELYSPSRQHDMSNFDFDEEEE